MPFALDSSPSTSEISEAINYLLGNFGANISADPNTGQVIGPTGQVSGYLYKYMAVKYADSFDGSVDFSNSPTNRLYFGLRNNNDPAESSNPADYIWYEAAGGFGVTKSLWYVSTGGRQIQFEVSVTAPDAGWLVDPGSSIDLDVVTSGNIPVIAEAFVPYFTPNTLQVPRTGTPLAPVFTNITPTMYATDAGAVVPFVDAQTDTAVNFVNGTWRIGNSSITGYADISKTNITIGDPTDAGDYAQWPNPTAMSASPAYITVPVRYKNNSGVVAQAGVATVQLVFTDPGPAGADGTDGTDGTNGSPGPTLDITGFTAFAQNAGGAFTPANATLSAVIANITSPTYSWTISGATPTSSTASSVVITPTSSSTGVTVTLTVNGSNLTSPLSKQVILPVVYDGAAGSAGANGLMSAFPTIYIWTGSSVPPTRPSTTSTYTWSTGAYTAPSGWSTEAPSNTTPGNFLWSITVPLNVSATTTTSTLDWTNTANPIRAIAYNGTDGINGTDGTNGLNGTRTAILDVYQWGATPPTSFPSGTSTYTWATGQFTAPAVLNGWSLSPPTPVLGQNLYIARQIFSDTNTSATSSITWTVATSTPISAAGVDGQNGARTAYLEVYQWAATTPTTFPSGTSTYTWADGAFTAPETPNSWSLTPGAATPGYTLYACSVSYSDTNTSATSTVTWSTNTAFVVGFAGNNGNNGSDGTNGTRTAILEMYIWSASAPTVFPSGNSTYTWATGQFTTPGVANGWSIIPQAAILGETLWVARVIYADTNVTATTSIIWNATVAYAISAAGVDGSDGTNGANGSRTAFLELYQWAAVLPTAFPAGNSTYTWADGSFTAPTALNGWSLTPGSSTPGYFLFACSVRYTDNLTTSTSTVTWNTSNAYVIGASGNNGTNGTNGSNGAATYVITRTANDSSAPTNAEVSALLGRNPVAGDICTVSYNSSNNAVVYRYTTAWVLFQTYITGSLIVQNTITGDKISANTITGTNIAATTITAANIAANTITSSQIAAGTITATQIAAATISAANMAANSITAGNAAIADAAITTAKIGVAQIDTLRIGLNQVSFTDAAASSGNDASVTVNMVTGETAFVSGICNNSPDYDAPVWTRLHYVKLGSTTLSSQTISSNLTQAGFRQSFPSTNISIEHVATYTGAHTFSAGYSGGGAFAGGATSVVVIGLKR